MSARATNRYCAPGGTVTRSPARTKSCGMSVGRFPKAVLPVPQGEAVVKSGAIAPGMRLIVLPGESSVFELLNTAHVNGVKSSPEQNWPTPQTSASPTGNPEITSAGLTPNCASEMISGGCGLSGMPPGPGFML